MKFVENAVAALLYVARPLMKHPDPPVSFFHQSGDGSRWAVIVSKIPEQEVAAA